ncbi:MULTISPECIES: hypothetical protein [Streptomyces]|uniref:Uncharacterized protein n=1 Tax=Streptomyces ramulosus TaxID=47762 RepID=A0ABW1FC06_9ACTN
MSDAVTTLETQTLFSVVPGGPPDVELLVGGKIGYPGVVLTATADGAVPTLTCKVTLPLGKGLQFVAEGGVGQYQLTVQPAQGDPKHYLGTLSHDGQTLTFTGVDPALSKKGAKSTLWVAVQAPCGGSRADTDLTFDVEGQKSSSTPIHVVFGFSVRPGGPPDVTLNIGGGPGYPGVVLTSKKTDKVPPQKITVTLPPGKGLQFVAEGGAGNYQLTVLPAQGGEKHYFGALSGDGQTLTFTGVDPALPKKDATSTAWVAVSAPGGATQGQTHLMFNVCGYESWSTHIDVKDTSML